MSGMGLDHRGVLTGGPRDGLVIDVPREVNGSLYFPVAPENPAEAWLEAMGSVLDAKPRYVQRDEYRISHPPRLNAAGSAVVYEYVGRV